MPMIIAHCQYFANLCSKKCVDGNHTLYQKLQVIHLKGNFYHTLLHLSSFEEECYGQCFSTF